MNRAVVPRTTDARVRIERDTGSTPVPLAEYGYNGLHQRIYKRVDTSESAQDPGWGEYDTQHRFYYSAGWQIIEELIDEEWDEQGMPDVDRTVEYVWGARYIDDIVMRAVTDHGESTLEMVYHLTDHQFSTVALIDSEANLLERVTYDAYGLARHHWAADVTGDGAVNDDDRAAMNAALNESIGDQYYNVDADITRTGTVTMTDAAHTGTSQYKAALPKGDLSAYGNVIGFSGYVFNPEVPTTGGGGGLYTVRFRHYDAELGRWLERDPLGYVDGMSLYGYAMGSPVVFSDPLGLLSVADCAKGLAVGFGGGLLDIVAGIGSLLLNPVDTVMGIIDGVMALADAVADGDLMEVLAIVAPEIHELLTKWNSLSDYDKCRLIGRILAIYGSAIVTGAGIYKLIVKLKHAKKKGVAAGAATKAAGCFLAGTLVAAANGAVPIENVRAGDEVWSFDEASQEWVLRKVEHAFEHIYFGDVVELTILHEDGSIETIDSTGNHPFWVVEGDGLAERPAVGELPTDEPAATLTGRWTEARHLRLGDYFLTRTGKSATVAGLTIRTERVKVYNLQVAELHLYAVGERGVLVHNSQYGKTPRGRNFTKHGADDAVKRQIPGHVIDDTIDNYPGVRVDNGKTVHYSPDNNVTVVTGDGGGIVSCRKGAPRPGQLP